MKSGSWVQQATGKCVESDLGEDDLNKCKLQVISFQNKSIFLQLHIIFSWVKSGTALHTDPPVISKINILIGPGHNLGAGECRFAGVGRIRSIKKPKS